MTNAIRAYHRNRILAMCDSVEGVLRRKPNETDVERIVADVMYQTGGKASPALVRELIAEYRSPS